MRARSAAAAVALVALGFGVHLWRQRQRQVVGYVKGEPMVLTVDVIDGKLVELSTAEAFLRMRAAASAAGVTLKIVSGFRTMAEQEHFFSCYQTGDCNNGNYAERPGYSNHQSGHALDLNTRLDGVSTWLQAHAWEFRFVNTIPSEPWHWEYHRDYV